MIPEMVGLGSEYQDPSQSEADRGGSSQNAGGEKNPKGVDIDRQTSERK